MATQASPVSWTDLSPSVQTALSWARTATPAGAPVGSAGLLFGILRAHAGYSEPEALVSHLGRPVADLRAALRMVSSKLDVDVTSSPTLSDVPQLAQEGDQVIRAAVNLASVYDVYKDGKVHVPHLFGAILRSGPNAEAHEALRTLLGESKAKASDDYVDFLRELGGNRSLKYLDFLDKHPLARSQPLPAPPESLVGRERELDEIRTALGERMVVFINGPRGTGKTALALRAASDALEAFPRGVIYVDGRTADAEAAVASGLARSEDALLVVDDADGLDLGRLLASASGPAIVVTTKPAPGGASGKHVAIGPLPPEEVQRLLRAGAPDSVPDSDLAQLIPVVGGLAASAMQLARTLFSGVRVPELVAESVTLLEETRPDGKELAAVSVRDAAAWKALEPRYNARQAHEQLLFRAVGLLETPFSTAQAALASETDAHTAEVILADLGSVGLVEEDDDGHWSLPEATRTFALSKLAGEPESERNRTVLQGLLARHASGVTEDEPRPLAGFRSDQPSEFDHIGFGADVEALCSVLIAREVTPPISVGLFGEWGTGKSTFMRLMRDRIRSLQTDWEGREASPFCKSVKQITFNAWNYSDANLWASLVTKIFDGLAAPDPEVEGDAPLDDPQRVAIVNALETAKATIAEKQVERDEAVNREADLKGRLATIAKAEREAGERLGDISPAQLIEQARESDKVKGLGAEVLARADKDGDTRDAVAIARELRSTWGFAAHTVRMLGPKRTIPLVALTLALVAVVAVAESSGIPIAGTVVAITSWLGGIAALARAPVEQARHAAAAADELLAGLREEEQAAVRREEAEVQRELAQLAAQRAQLDSELQDATSAAARAEREIEDIRSGRRIAQFVEERATSTEYRQYLGLIAVIRRDFDELTRLLLDRDVENKPPFDRIVLYIDDLDRCRADLVVQVLEAVHLLLALKLFVVVVGVDPRWLNQSLKRHYIGQLGLESGDEPDPDAEEWATTPQNYLEKIFQIPFALAPMGPDGFRRMMGELFELRAVERKTEPADTPPSRQTEAIGRDDGDPARGDPAPVAAPEPTPLHRERTHQLLRIWPAELAFIQRLGLLVPTPRAANRLANTYRLIRVRQDDPGLSRFVTRDGEAGEYRVALVLLTVVVGFSEIADDVFRRLLDGEPANFWHFVEALAAPEDGSPQTAATYERLRDGLLALREETAIPEEITVYREWVPRVGRYSFETARTQWEDSISPAAPA